VAEEWHFISVCERRSDVRATSWPIYRGSGGSFRQNGGASTPREGLTAFGGSLNENSNVNSSSRNAKKRGNLPSSTRGVS